MKFTFNKQFMVLMFLLLNCFASYAANEDLITNQITRKLTKAGTLHYAIGSSWKDLVTNLKIIGEINGTDLRFIREMAGSDVEGHSTSGNLSVLDLSEARFVAGGDYYYCYSGHYYYTSNDIIGASVFSDCRSLTSVIIPSSVTEIGWGAFKYCRSLTSVNIPSSVTEIGESAFSCCRSLINVNIPFRVTSIGKGAFSGCSSLTSVNIPSSVKSIGEIAFSGCSSLTSINIPSSVKSIGGSAFSGCSSLTSVKIPSSVTKIESGTFNYCTSLTSVNIPLRVTSIGESAFENCSGLRSIYVYAETVPSISANAFNGCDSENCILYVPKGTYDAYWLSEWGYFENIVEFDATNIRNIAVESEVQETARYAVNGQRLTAPVKGINLVKYNNGRVKKEIVK